MIKHHEIRADSITSAPRQASSFEVPESTGSDITPGMHERRQGLRRRVIPESQFPKTYRQDTDFRRWLRRIQLRHNSLRDDIFLNRPMSIYEKPTRSLRRAVTRFFRSHDVQWRQFHDAWMRGGDSKTQTIAERQASFYEFWRSSSDGSTLPWELDPSKQCDETFSARSQEKKIGGWRTVYKFGLVRSTRHRMVLTALRAAAATCSGFNYVQSGGLAQLAKDVTRAIRETPGLNSFASFDIRTCFDAVDLSDAHLVLPVGRKVVQQTIAIDPREAIDQRLPEHRRFSVRYHFLYRSQSFATRSPLALPQGAASSPIVAYTLIQAGCPPLPYDRVFQYGDDCLILGTSQQDVEAQSTLLTTQLERHAAGPLQLHMQDSGRLEDGAQFVGLCVLAKPGRPGSQGNGFPWESDSAFVSVRVGTEARERFRAIFRNKIALGIASHDFDLTEACSYAKHFLLSKPTDDRFELLNEACGIARDLGANELLIETTLGEALLIE
jgi:hypothetical protein